MQPDRFRQLVDAKGPFASVYFDDSHDTEDAAEQLDIKLRDLRSVLEEQGAEPAVTEGLEQAIRDSAPAVGKSGRAMVAASGGVLFDQRLPGPPPSLVVRVSDLPYLIPVVEHASQQPDFAVVAVDHAGGDIELHHHGRVVKETVDGPAYPVHKASSAESPGYGDPQRTADNARRKNVQTVADRVTALVDELSPEVVFVVGEVRSRTDLVSELPERVVERSVELSVGARTDIAEDELHRGISEEFERRHRAALDDVAERFVAELRRDSGLATEGIAGVTAGLRLAAVETLIIGDMGDATVVAGDDLATVSPSAEVLSQFGVPPTQVLRADEALPMLAISTGAALMPAAEQIDPADGIGAILRYTVP
jgi:hypothetical protein